MSSILARMNLESYFLLNPFCALYGIGHLHILCHFFIMVLKVGEHVLGFLFCVWCAWWLIPCNTLFWSWQQQLLEGCRLQYFSSWFSTLFSVDHGFKKYFFVVSSYFNQSLCLYIHLFVCRLPCLRKSDIVTLVIMKSFQSLKVECFLLKLKRLCVV